MKQKILLLSLWVVFTCPNLFAQNNLLNITGKVVDENNQPLQGVSVKAGKTGAATDANGVFRIAVAMGSKLSFSSVGYSSKTITVETSAELSVKLETNKSQSSLEEVVVVGYGTVKKKDLTGSVVSIKPEELKQVPSSNIMESIQGKVAGVDIVSTSGLAGATPTVTIRGNRSIVAGNAPLYIVDGIPYANYADVGAVEIQSMEILKDASSTAIYGSRGANGVVLITTKKGGTGALKVNVSSYYGVSSVAGYPVPMDGAQFTNLKQQAYRTIGKWSSAADNATIFTTSELAGITNNVSTYWPSLVLGKGSQQDYNIGMSTGNEKTKVYAAVDYFKETGLLENDYYNKYAFYISLDQKLTSNLKLILNAQLVYYNQNARNDGVLTVANKVKPLYLPYNADGSIAVSPGSDNQFNPILDNQAGVYVNKTKTTRILTTGSLEWKPAKGLTLRSNFGVVSSNAKNGFFAAANSLDRLSSTGSLSRMENNEQMNISWENIVNYQKTFNVHTIDISAITGYFSDKTEGFLAQGTGQLLPSQLYYALQNNPNNVKASSNYVGSDLLGGALRINYSLKSKYLLTLTGRMDGSSVLAPQNRWSFFPSIAAAWRASQETFIKNLNLFSDLKLRVSYGISGNAAVKPYQTQSGVILIPTSWNDQNVVAYGLNAQTGNPNLNWEKTKSLDIGLDFAILNDRVRGSVDYYNSNTYDLLLLRMLPASSGVQRVLENIGKVKNKGIEVYIASENIKTKNFSWNTALTFTANKEAIVYLPDNQNDIASGLFIGAPIKSFYDYQKIGIWQLPDSVLAKSYGYNPGDIRVKDQYNRGKITADSDRVVLGSAVPKYYIGLNNEFKFKNIDFSFFLFARVGQMFVSDYANKFEPNAIENSANVNFWTPENPTNDYPRPNANISRAALPFATTLGYKDGSFLKLRSITLGYTLPQKLTKRWHINSLRWYVTARNFLTISKVKDYDPEGGGSFEQPLTKLIVMGLNINL